MPYAQVRQFSIGMTGEDMEFLSGLYCIPAEQILEEGEKRQYRCWLISVGELKPFICTIVPGPITEDGKQRTPVLVSIELDREEMARLPAQQQVWATQRQANATRAQALLQAQQQPQMTGPKFTPSPQGAFLNSFLQSYTATQGRKFFFLRPREVCAGDLRHRLFFTNLLTKPEKVINAIKQN